MNAIALSPDGRTVACGGWMECKDEPGFCIYLFDARNGMVERRIGGLPNVVHQLAYSEDGRRLVAGLSGDSGIRIYETEGYEIAGQDSDYREPVYGADFDAAGRLVTTSLDGGVRLYGADLRLVALRNAPRDGGEPYQVAFSPDGGKIALGYHEASEVSILSGRDLSLLLAPAVTDLDDYPLASVAWSADGEVLYAGGELRNFRAGPGPIRRWPEGGKGAHADVPIASLMIVHMLPLGDGSIAFCDKDPAWGVLDAAGRLRHYRKAEIPFFRGQFDKLLVSHDGKVVQFGFEAWGASPARFSLRERMLALDPAPDPALLSARTAGEKIRLSDWLDTPRPKLNGKPLDVEPFENAKSAALTADGNGFLLGTEWFLRRYNEVGRPLWQTEVPAIAWAANAPAAGGLAVAAHGDGTIRWYRLWDGKELLAFFAHGDRTRWILWTPSGYYDASPGGEDLIGWHLNRGTREAADFFPAGRFRSAYYRPDVVARILDTLDEDEAVALANGQSAPNARRPAAASLRQLLPPIVSIIAPRDGEVVRDEKIVVRFSVRSPSGVAVLGAKALIDGRPAASIEGARLTRTGVEHEGRIEVRLPKRACKLSIIAWCAHAASEPATVRLRWGGEPMGPVRAASGPNLRVLAVGVSRRESDGAGPRYAAADARAFAQAAIDLEGKPYSVVAAKVLTGGDATWAEIRGGLDWVRRETGASDVAMIFFAGLGSSEGGRGFRLLPADADPAHLEDAGVALADVVDTVASTMGRVLVFLDASRWGAGEERAPGPTDMTAVANELASPENGAAVYVSATGNHRSFEAPSWGTGAFAKALVEGLRGSAAAVDTGVITVGSLADYVLGRVLELTEGRQVPAMVRPETVPDSLVAYADRDASRGTPQPAGQGARPR